MLAYIIRRLLLMIPTLLGISLAVFFLIHMVPGGPVEQAIKKAEEYLSAHPIEHPDYIWVTPEPKDFGDRWYFDYELEHKGALPPDQWDEFGGAPGFCVFKNTGAVADVTWDEYQTNAYGE